MGAANNGSYYNDIPNTLFQCFDDSNHIKIADTCRTSPTQGRCDTRKNVGGDIQAYCNSSVASNAPLRKTCVVGNNYCGSSLLASKYYFIAAEAQNTMTIYASFGIF